MVYTEDRLSQAHKMGQIINFDFTRNKFNDIIIKIRLYRIMIL